MNLLRSTLRIRWLNHALKAGGSLLPPNAARRFERKLPLVDPFVIHLPNGNTIQFEPFGDTCSKFLKFDGWNGYERSSVELFFALAQHAEVCFDVGAYLGYFGLLAAAARNGSRAFLFEAVPQLANYARVIAGRNPLLNVEVIPAAVADHSGQITLYLPDDPLDSDTSTAEQHRPGRRAVSVPALTLDEFVRERQLDRVDLLKLDTETTEPAVLAGFSQTIAGCRPTFLCEVLPTADVAALEAFRARFGYACAWVRADGLHPMPRIVPDERIRDMNYVFYPEGTASPIVQELLSRLRPAS